MKIWIKGLPLLFLSTSLSLSSFAAVEVQGNRDQMVSFLEQAQSSYLEQKPALESSEEELGLTSINLGLLQTIFVKVPDYDQRSDAFIGQLADHAESRGTDFTFVQEVWHEKDILKLQENNSSQGMISVAQGAKESGYEQKKSGLDIRINMSKVEAVESTEFRPFLDESGDNIRSQLEQFGGYQRGALVSVVLLKSGKRVALLNTHLTANALGANNADLRKRQLNALLEIIGDLKKDTDLVILGADFNISPLWEAIEGRDMDGSKEHWDENAELYSYFVEKSGMVDTFNAIHGASEGYTQDPTQNATTDKSNSTKNEPRQRLDYVFVSRGDRSKDARGGIAVKGAEVSLTKEVSSGVNLSDHFGVSATIAIQ